MAKSISPRPAICAKVKPPDDGTWRMSVNPSARSRSSATYAGALQMFEDSPGAKGAHGAGRGQAGQKIAARSHDKHAGPPSLTRRRRVQNRVAPASGLTTGATAARIKHFIRLSLRHDATVRRPRKAPWAALIPSGASIEASDGVSGVSGQPPANRRRPPFTPESPCAAAIVV
jgi:hypothetical protein